MSGSKALFADDEIWQVFDSLSEEMSLLQVEEQVAAFNFTNSSQPRNILKIWRLENFCDDLPYTFYHFPNGDDFQGFL